jgi:protein tyrosine phosphatase (PTP) superfamily phosphohydrolase (DUF442 family)
VVAPPLEFEGTAYDRAGAVRLPERKPEDSPGLHHVYRLSPDLISGSEPEGEEAFRKLRDMGVKTILSVDGKAPNVELAAKYGLRYVHIPIQYKGMTPEEILRISKLFREAEGPIYTHCFHGNHRGPASIAIGRLVRDGADRDTAIREMRQYCETSKKYEGLYVAVAKGAIPSAAETAAYRYDFPSAQPFQGIRAGMIDSARSFDPLKEMSKSGWKADPEHPDLEAGNEAAKLAGLFATMAASEENRKKPGDFRRWMAASAAECATLKDLLEKHRKGDAAAGKAAGEAFARMEKSCNDCHAVYRNG